MADPLATGGVVAKPTPQIIDNGGIALPAPKPTFNAATAPIVKPESLGADSAKLVPGAAVDGQPGSTWQHNGQGWVIQPGGGAAPAPGATPAAAPGAPGAPQTAQQVLTGTPQAGPPTTAAGAFQQALMSNLAPGQVTADSASIAPQIQANQLAQQRGMERQRAQNAERNAAQGTSMSGGANTEQIGLEQARAAQEGQFSADAIAGQTDKDRQAQLMMSQLAGGMLTNQGAQDLQKYGIDTGAATSKYGVDANKALGQGDLSLRDKLGTGQLNLGLAGLLSSNDNYDKGLSSNNSQFSAGLNQQAILKMLGL